MENGSKVQIPEIGKQTMSTQRDERKGAGVGLLAKLGLGGGAASSGAGGLAAGGGLLAGKAGVVALILAGSSVAAGIGMLTMGGGNANAPRAGASLFARAEGEAPPVDSAETARDSAAAVAGSAVSGSLDNFNSANKGAVVDPYAPAKVEETSDPASEQPADAPAAVPDHTTTQSAGTAPPKSGPAPKMVKSSGFGSGASASGGSSASGGGVVARAGAGAKANVGGAQLAGSTAMRGGGMRGAAGARRSAIMRGGGAAGQLRAHSSVLKGNLGSGNISSAGSGAVMDGAGQAGTLGGGAGSIAAGGQGTGAKGVDTSPGASTSKNLRDVSPPPEPIKDGKNVTSYQKEMMIAMGAMLGAMALLFIAGMISDKAKAASATPWVAAPLYAQAKNLAMMATALAAVATGIGVWLMMQKGQMMQGAMLTVVGGIMTFQAGKAWITGSEAAAEAQAQSTGAANQMAANTPGLQGATATSVSPTGQVTFSNGATATMTPPASAAPGAGVVDAGYSLGNVQLPASQPAPTNLPAGATDLPPKLPPGQFYA